MQHDRLLEQMAERLVDLSDDDIASLPIDQVAMLVLRYLVDSKEWSQYNFLLGAARRNVSEPAQLVLAEALNWLIGKNLVARGTPGQTSAQAIFVTRLGHQTLEAGLAPLRASERLGVALHERLSRVRSQFLLGEYELAAFAAMREVEIRVRELARADPSLIGVKLMRTAFGEGGSLADPKLDPGERVGRMELFAGAIGTFKNPPSHRQVNYSDPTEASEVILLADLLMRLLDRERRPTCDMQQLGA